MFSLDEDDEGEASFGESSDAEREVTPDIPKAPSVKTFDDGGGFEAASDIDSDTLRAFVVAVIYANAALLLVALGPMVWYFEGWSKIGPILFVAGLLAGVRTYQTYRAWERSRDDVTEADVTEADAAEADAVEADAVEADATDGDSASDSVDSASDDDRDPSAPPEA